MWCTTATSTCSLLATRKSVARTGISASQVKRVARSGSDWPHPVGATTSPRRRRHAADVGPRRRDHHLLRRSLAARRTPSAGFRGGPPHRPTPHPSASRSRAPLSRTPPPCCTPVTARATGRGTTVGSGRTTAAPTAGRGPATSGSNPPAPVADSRGQSARWWAPRTPCAPKARRPGRLLTAPTSRIAEMLSPPRSKNESSTPTCLSPSTWP